MPVVVRPAMSDGRAFTVYLSQCEFNENLKQNFGVRTEAGYRAKLQNNARAFDARAKQYADFMPYYGTGTCPKPADDQRKMLATLPQKLT